MKYGVVILGGAADESLDALDGRTALEAASMPTLDAIARAGRVGGAITTPPEQSPSSEVALMALLGCDPIEALVARGPIEAMGMGVDLQPDESACRCSLVTVGIDGDRDHGVLLNHATPSLTTPEARALFEAVEQAWRLEAPEDSLSLRLVTGDGHRAVLIDSSGRPVDEAATWAPHEVVRRSWERAAPEGDDGAWMRRLMEISYDALRNHEVNRARRENDLQPATMLWMWGLGRTPRRWSFEEAYGLRAAMVTGRAVGAGVARALGIDRVPAPGLTSGGDTNYESMGAAAAAALDRYDLVIVDASSPDAASHRGDPVGKAKALEAIDRQVITPLRDRLAAFGDAESSPMDDPQVGWRLLVAVDHATSSRSGEHFRRRAPFAISGAWVRSVVERECTEAHADASDLVVDPGFELMEYALYSAIKGAQRSRFQRPRAGAQRDADGGTS